MYKFLFAGILLVSSLRAEIDEVMIQWTPMLCQGSCVQGLYQQFGKIPGLANVEISQPQGQALLIYQRGAPYTYGPINTAMAMIGLSINQMRAKVTGFISHSERDVFLTSTGDGTIFTLISPLRPQPYGYAVPYDYNLYNSGNRPLNDMTREQLLEAEQAQVELTIAGPIFVPERSPPNYLITESIKPKQQQPQQQQQQR